MVMPTERAIEKAHAYAQSRRKAYLVDYIFALATMPLAGYAAWRARECAEPHGLPAVFRSQARVGADNTPFIIEKFTTLYQNEHGQDVVINDVAAWMRRTRFDELAQVKGNIWGGLRTPAQRTMVFAGYRPLTPPEEQQFRDELSTSTRCAYDRIVVPTRPGVASTFAHQWATGADVGSEQRALMNIDDVMNGSVAYDLTLGLRLGNAMAQSRLQDRRLLEGNLTMCELPSGTVD